MPKEGVGVVLGVRFTGQEFHRIAQRAEHEGKTVLEFVREAALLVEEVRSE
jgi:hypothetical protein